MTEYSIPAKLTFVAIMIFTSPIWFPLCIIYGIIIGPIGYWVLFIQGFSDGYLFNKIDYEKYLQQKASGEWKDGYLNYSTGLFVKNILPDSPRMYIVKVCCLILGSAVIFVPLGIITGPISAVQFFWRRLFLSFFPDEILKIGV